MNRARQLRILFLLLILFAVAANTWLTRLRTTTWERPLVVAIYPLNADGSAAATAHIAALERDDFADIEDFFAEEASHYGLALKQPFEIVLGPTLHQPPPLPAAEPSLLGNVWWSLRMRFWAWRVAREYGPPANIQLFVRYHDPASHPRLAHSLGLQKGLTGMVNAFAGRRAMGGNHLIIAHELLHTVGASDKYDPASDLPRYPVGYAEPAREPLYPQEYAEIMAGRIPLGPRRAVQARSLSRALVGPWTALEIRWIDELPPPYGSLAVE